MRGDHLDAAMAGPKQHMEPPLTARETEVNAAMPDPKRVLKHTKE